MSCPLLCDMYHNRPTLRLDTSLITLVSASCCEVGPVTDEDFDDDDYDTFRETGEESGVQLGTVLPLEGSLADSVLFKNVDWHEWDGGKAGGWPVRCMRYDVRIILHLK